MRSNSYAKEIAVAKKLALKAGKIMLKYFDIDQQIKTKSDNTPVTVADIKINDMVVKELSKEFPEDGIIGEEKSTSDYGQGRKWFCDPIDGTAGYIWGTPTSMFSLGLVIDGKPMLGVAYDPFLKRMYEGVKGNGSLCNGKQLHVSQEGLNTGRLAVTGSISSLPNLPYIPELKKQKVRLATFSGAVYKCCLIARGKFVGYVEHGVQGHDFAAIHVIVEEAGGKITGLAGEELDYSKPFKGGIVSNGEVHEQLVDILKRFPIISHP